MKTLANLTAITGMFVSGGLALTAWTLDRASRALYKAAGNTGIEERL